MRSPSLDPADTWTALDGPAALADNRTMIVVTHDLSTVRPADRILVP